MRTVIGYVDGAKVWSDNEPAVSRPWGQNFIGGGPIEAVVPPRAVSNPNSKEAIRKRERRTRAERDYLASSLKGWETRRGAA